MTHFMDAPSPDGYELWGRRLLPRRKGAVVRVRIDTRVPRKDRPVPPPVALVRFAIGDHEPDTLQVLISAGKVQLFCEWRNGGYKALLVGESTYPYLSTTMAPEVARAVATVVDDWVDAVVGEVDDWVDTLSASAEKLTPNSRPDLDALADRIADKVVQRVLAAITPVQRVQLADGTWGVVAPPRTSTEDERAAYLAEEKHATPEEWAVAKEWAEAAQDGKL